MSKHRRGKSHGRFMHGHQSNGPHFVWMGIGFALGIALFIPLHNLVTYLFR